MRSQETGNICCQFFMNIRLSKPCLLVKERMEFLSEEERFKSEEIIFRLDKDKLDETRASIKSMLSLQCYNLDIVVRKQGRIQSLFV